MSVREEQILKAVTYRISAATQQELPGTVRAATHQLLDCKPLLSSESSTRKGTGENVALHKFRAQVTTFVSGKSPEARWAGTILIKTAVELGGYEALSKSGGWVRSLMQVLIKPDAASTKKLAVLALTRIFDLTHGHQSLVRELTTPSLKDYINITLNLLQSKKGQAVIVGDGLDHDLLATILQSFAQLLPSHPSIFRYHLSRIENLLLSLMASGQTSRPSRSVQASARKLFTLLHYCTPKTNSNSPADSYAKALASVIRSSHGTCSLVFRSIIEDWSPLPGNDVPHVKIPVEVELRTSESSDELQLPPWVDIGQGCRRLRELLSLLRDFLQSPTAGQMMFPLVASIDLVLRTCAVTVPPVSKASKSRSQQCSIRINDQISQREREGLLNELPSIHASAVDLISALCKRLGSATKPVQEILLEQVLWVFAREKYNESLRTACYAAMTQILGASADSFTKESVRQCDPIMKSCCDDLLPPTRTVSMQETTGQLDADVLMGTTGTLPGIAELADYTALTAAASDLLVAALISIPPHHLSQTLRAKLDRVAILSRNKDAMLASTLNPAPAGKDTRYAGPSLVPFLAQHEPSDLAVESLLRPRMPAVRAGDASRQFETNGELDDDSESIDQEEADKDDGADYDMDENQGTTPEAVSGDVEGRNQTEEVPAVAMDFEDAERYTSRKRSTDETDSGDHAQAKKIRLDEASDSVPTVRVPPQPTTGSAIAPQPTVLPDTTTSTTADRETVTTMPAPESEMQATHKPARSSNEKTKLDVESDTDESEFEIPKIHMPDTDDEEEED